VVEADDHEPVDRRRGDRALKRTPDWSHREKADAALVGNATDAVEERGEERICEDRRDRLREEHTEDTDALRVKGSRVRIRRVPELARRVEDAGHRRGPKALRIVEGVGNRGRGDASFAR